MENEEKIKKPPLFVNVFLFLGVCLIMFGLAEIACRLFYDESVNYEKRVWESLQGLQSFELAAIKNKTFVDETDGMEYRLGSRSLYEPRYLYFDYSRIHKTKSPNKYRIAVIGDSFTMGGGLENNSKYRYTEQLYAMLNDKQKVNVRGIDEFEVLTFTDSGINSYQELILLKDLAMDYAPDLVVLQYTDNDISTVRSELGFNGSGLYIRSRTHLLMLGSVIVPALPYLNKEINWFLLKHSVFFKFLSYKLNIMLVKNNIINADPASSFDSLKKMNEIVKSNNIPFIIIEMPPASLRENYCGEQKGGYGGISLHNKLRKLSADLGIQFYNMCDYVSDIHSLKSENELDDCHYNREGYRIAAEILKKAALDIISKTK